MNRLMVEAATPAALAPPVSRIWRQSDRVWD
jgi:hypothetical protein